MDLNTADIAATVRAEVARRRITQEQIGAATNLNQRAVSRRLLGQVRFTLADLTAVAPLLEMSVDELLALAHRDAQQRSA